MIVPDVNLLLYAHVDAFAPHERARAWWEDTMSGPAQVGLCAPTALGFVRLVTSRRVLATPLATDRALALVATWLDRPSTRYLASDERHLRAVLGLLGTAGTAGNLTTDAQIAAHAIAVDGEVHSNDTDFGRFAGLRWVNPLAA